MSNMVEESALEYIFQNNLRNWGIPTEVSNGILSKMFDNTRIDMTSLEKLAEDKITSLIVKGGTDRPGLLDVISAGLSMTDLANSRGDTLEIYNMISLGIGFRPGGGASSVQQKFFTAISGADSAEIKGITGWRSLMVDGPNKLRTLFEGHINIDKQCNQAEKIAGKEKLPDKCWLCDGEFGETNQTKQVCEHVLPVTVASMANMLITGHDNRADVYGAEYKWSHFCCNARKADILPVSIESEGTNKIMMVINKPELDKLVETITKGCQSEIGDYWGGECNKIKLTEVLQPAVNKFNEYLNSKAEGSITESDRSLIAKLEILFDIVLRPFVVGMNVLKSIKKEFANLSYEQIYNQINKADISTLCRIIYSEKNQMNSEHILLSIMYLLLIQGRPINDILTAHFNLCNRFRLIRGGTVFILHCIETGQQSLINADLKKLMLSHFEETITFANEIKGKGSNPDWKKEHIPNFNETLKQEIMKLYYELQGSITFSDEDQQKLSKSIQPFNEPERPRGRSRSRDRKPPRGRSQRRSSTPPRRPSPPHPYNTRSKRGGGLGTRKHTRRSSRRLTTPTPNKGKGIGRGTPRTPRKRAITSKRTKERKRIGTLIFNSNNEANYKSNNEFILRQTVFMSLLTHSMPDEDIKETRREMGLEFIGLNGQTGGSQSRTPRRSSRRGISTRKSPSGKTGSKKTSNSTMKRFPKHLSFNNYKKDAFNNYKKDAFNFGFGQFIISKKAYEMNKNKSIPETAEDIAELLKNSLK